MTASSGDAPLFAYQEGQRAAKRAAGKLPAAFVRQVQRAIRVCAASRDEFTTDDVLDDLRCRGIVLPDELRGLGALMGQAAKAGIIIGTDRYRRSVERSCHGRPKRVWRRP